MEDAPAKLEQLSRELDGKQKTLKEQIARETAKERRKQELDRLIPRQEEQLGTLKNQLEQRRLALTADRTALQETTRQAEELKSRLRFADKKAAAEALALLERQANGLRQARADAEQAFRDQEKRLTELKAKVKQLRTLLDGAEAPDRKELEGQQRELTGRKAVLVREQKEVHARLTVNRAALDNITAGAQRLTELEQRWQWMSDLARTANGTNRGQVHIALETYVQMTFFDRILARANTHLMRMSGGKYDLKRQENAEDKLGQKGLELNVIDHYNGTERSVKSLSGGESFLASLSLALGMAEEIQASAGGIRLDTMFVDEGFGSLDEDTLEQAMQALTGLTEGSRLIGIISHVAELRERINKQIVVKKEKTGGSRAEIRLG